MTAKAPPTRPFPLLPPSLPFLRRPTLPRSPPDENLERGSRLSTRTSLNPGVMRLRRNSPAESPSAAATTMRAASRPPAPRRAIARANIAPPISSPASVNSPAHVMSADPNA